MPGHVYKRGEIYWIKFSHKGQRYHTSSKSERKRDAEKLLVIYLGEIASGTFKGIKTDVPGLSMGELLDDFEADCHERGLRGMNRVVSHLKPVRAYFGRMSVSDVTVRRVDLFKKKRKDEFERVILHLPDYLVDMVRFAYHTAWRKGEIGASGFEPPTFGSQIRHRYFVVLLVFLVCLIFSKICRYVHFLVLARFSGCFLLPS